MGGLTLPSSAGRSARRHGRADQKIQGVFILRHQLRVAGDVSRAASTWRLGLTQVQFGREPDVITPPDQIVGGLLRLQGGFRQFEVFPVRGQGQIGVGHCGHQQDLCAAAGLLRGQVFFQRPIFQAADAAEEINLPGTDTEIDIVLFGGHRAPGGRKIGRNTLFAPAADRIDRRQKLGSLNAVQGARPFDIQGGKPQIAVVVQGHLDDSVEASHR